MVPKVEGSNPFFHPHKRRQYRKMLPFCVERHVPDCLLVWHMPFNANVRFVSDVVCAEVPPRRASGMGDSQPLLMLSETLRTLKSLKSLRSLIPSLPDTVEQNLFVRLADKRILTMRKFLAYFIPVLLCFAVGLLSSYVQSSAVDEWYPTLVK